MNQSLQFNFEGKDYEADITLKKFPSNDYYYVALKSNELTTRFSISYLFDYTRCVGLQYVSTMQNPKNEPLVETLKTALNYHIQNDTNGSTSTSKSDTSLQTPEIL